MNKCYKCKLPITFIQNDNGKWCPVNPDGTFHWDLCRETNKPAFRMIIGKTMKAKTHLVHVYCPNPPFIADKPC